MYDFKSDLYNMGNDYPQWVKKVSPIPPTPTTENGVRFTFVDGVDPTKLGVADVTWKKVEDSNGENVWDAIFDKTSSNHSFSGKITTNVCPKTKVNSINLEDINIDNMFRECDGINEIIDGSFNSINNAIHSFEQTSIVTIPSNTFSSLEIAESTFENCGNLSAINATFPSLTYAGRMFYNCTNLKDLAPESFENLTVAPNMFEGCSTLNNLASNTFNKVVNATEMFEDTNITRIDDLSFENVISAEKMFKGCGKLSAIGAEFNKVTNANNMFSGCSSLKEIPVAFSGVISANGMFASCTNLSSILISTYFQSLKHLDYMFENCSSLTSTLNTGNSGFESFVGLYKNCINLQINYDYAEKLLGGLSSPSIYSGCFYGIPSSNFDTSAYNLITTTYPEAFSAVEHQ